MIVNATLVALYILLGRLVKALVNSCRNASVREAWRIAYYVNKLYLVNIGFPDTEDTRHIATVCKDVSNPHAQNACHDAFTQANAGSSNWFSISVSR